MKRKRKKKSANPPRSCTPADMDACVLGKHEWDKPTSECGEGAPSVKDAASRLAKKRWTAEDRRVAAKLLRP